jgi:AraC-like DNA-binding protein
VNWASDWFDKSIRPNTPPPLSVLIFPIIFYAHSLWAIPNYLNKQKWITYVFCFILLFIVPELLRSSISIVLTDDVHFWDEFSNRDSLLLGQPSPLWMALICSFAYRFTKDWFTKQRQIDTLGKQLSEHQTGKTQESQPLDTAEANMLLEKLEFVLNQSQPYLNQDLSLAELAKLVGSTDKKVSTLLNQNMHTSFYDYINSFRLTDFKKGVAEGKLEHLSIVGLALQCGFKSKSSFYRAFKKETGMSPSQYIH